MVMLLYVRFDYTANTDYVSVCNSKRTCNTPSAPNKNIFAVNVCDFVSNVRLTR